MKQRRWHPARCKVCGSDGKDSGGISARGRCLACGIERQTDNLIAMQTKRGPYAQHWASQLAASVGYGPLDGTPPRP